MAGVWAATALAAGGVREQIATAVQPSATAFTRREGVITALSLPGLGGFVRYGKPLRKLSQDTGNVSQNSGKSMQIPAYATASQS